MCSLLHFEMNSLNNLFGNSSSSINSGCHFIPIINFLLSNSKHSTKSLYDTADILAYFSTFPLGAIML